MHAKSRNICCLVYSSPPICKPGLLLESKTHYCIVGNFHEELPLIRQNIIRKCIVFVDKDRAIVLIHENIIREMLYREFLPQKFPAIRHAHTGSGGRVIPPIDSLPRL